MHVSQLWMNAVKVQRTVYGTRHRTHVPSSTHASAGFMLKLVVGKRSWDSYISEMKLSFSLVSIAISTASEKHICKRLMLCTYAVHEALVSLFVRKRLALRCLRSWGRRSPPFRRVDPPLRALTLGDAFADRRAIWWQCGGPMRSAVEVPIPHQSSSLTTRICK